MMFGNCNAYQPIGAPQQFAMDQMQQNMQLIRVTGIDGAGIPNASQFCRAPV